MRQVENIISLISLNGLQVLSFRVLKVDRNSGDSGK